jgi:hypothetical protein
MPLRESSRPDRNWHDDTIREIARLVGSYPNLLSLSRSAGSRRGADIVVRRACAGAGRWVNIEIQAQPWRPLPEAAAWAERHFQPGAVATIIVCPEAHLERALESIRAEQPRLGESESLFLFHDKQLEQLAATVFSLLWGRMADEAPPPGT